MKEITAKEVLKHLTNGETLNVIDVREDAEVAQGTIPGAKHIPLGDLPERLDELEKDKHYVMICRSGNRSANACQFLNEQGYGAANMVDGIIAWEGEIEK